MAICTAVTTRQLVPNCNAHFLAITYSKANTDDYWTATLDSPIKAVRFAIAADGGAGAEDPVAISGAVVTMTAGTGAGYMLVIGTC